MERKYRPKHFNDENNKGISYVYKKKEPSYIPSIEEGFTGKPENWFDGNYYILSVTLFFQMMNIRDNSKDCFHTQIQAMITISVVIQAHTSTKICLKIE